MNNPINIIDRNGKNGIAIIDNENCIITVEAVFIVGNDGDEYAESKICEANDFLNAQNYGVTEGQYAGYSVEFNLIPVQAESGINTINTPDMFNYGDINIGNTYQTKGEDWRFLDKEKGWRSFAKMKDGTQIGGYASENRDIVMNNSSSKTDNLRNRIHEIFHCFFFPEKKDAKHGIESYKNPEMPNSSNINKLIDILIQKAQNRP